MIVENDHKVILNIDIDQEIISITKDKLELKLNEYTNNMLKKRDISFIFGLFLSSLITIISCDFKNYILPADSWKTIIQLILLASILLLLYHSYNYFKYKDTNVENLLLKIQNIKIEKTSFNQKFMNFINRIRSHKKNEITDISKN